MSTAFAHLLLTTSVLVDLVMLEMVQTHEQGVEPAKACEMGTCGFTEGVERRGF